MTPLTTLAVACVAAWIGITAFFSFAAAPLLFRVIDRGVAGAAVAALLPRYYVTGLVLSTVALLALLVAVARRAPRRGVHAIGALLTATMVVLLGIAFGVVLPEANAARAARDDTAFALAHRASVRLNGLTLAAAIGVIVLETVSARQRRGR